MSKPSTKQKVKDVANSLLSKLIDSLDPKNDEDTPPAPPPKPSGYATPAAVDANLIQSFNALNVASPPPRPPMNDPGFIGGFHPSYVTEESGPPRPTRPNYSAPPSTMPMPFGTYPPDQQSLTMQMALDPSVNMPPRPTSNPSKPTASKPSSSTPYLSQPSKPANGRPAALVSGSSTPSSPPAKPPVTPTKPRPSKGTAGQTPTRISSPEPSTSAPSTPSGKAGQVQCSGTTKAGKQCTRFVKAAPALDQVTDEDYGELNPPLERFCFQHTKELLSPSGCYARKNGEWVEFEAWIPSYLQTETQLALRIEMERSRSQSDVDGYIYTFEIRDDETETVKLKVGRAVNLVKRIDQWGKQCGSKEQVLRGYYPGPEAQGVDENEATLMKGRVRAERLIHLELADLTATCVYLEPSWPNIAASPSPPGGKSTAKKDRCKDCGTMHKEIFEFQRWSSEGNKNKEWETIVKPVIERWGSFVSLYV
ncbi:hypothetical protein D9611_004587 [Ephemerocybe angulata]|uniref:DUF1766-domain-containing protein n=1 Tax=Ephemerocybe angulata TaxID=980116 RepID=A0A8H5BKS7_9AGAR|nr:hypothetical protein D9611_004587 [Tulosesus angulatus]